jgi:hypothetical protein
MIDIGTLIFAMSGIFVGLISCSLAPVLKKTSYMGFAFSGFFTVLGMFLLYFFKIVISSIKTTNPNWQIVAQNTIPSFQWCGYLALIFATLIFIISIYINMFVETKKEVKGSKMIGSKK